MTDIVAPQDEVVRTIVDALAIKLTRGEETTRSDIDAGVANVVVGFAPLKPAEFVIVTIRQLLEKQKP